MKARRLLIPSLGAALFFSMSAIAQDPGATPSQGSGGGDKAMKTSAMDKKFVTEAAQGGLAEVDLGNVAKSNGSNDDVKKFGDQMVTDHSKANDELKDLAQKKGWTLPSEPKAADKAKKDRLSKKNGDAFDKAYMRDMVMDHEKDVKDFKKCASSCSDPDLKDWAGKTVSTLEGHLKMAKDTAEKIGALNGGHGSAKSGKKPSAADAGGKPSGAIQ